MTCSPKTGPGKVPSRDNLEIQRQTPWRLSTIQEYRTNLGDGVQDREFKRNPPETGWVLAGPESTRIWGEPGNQALNEGKSGTQNVASYPHISSQSGSFNFDSAQWGSECNSARLRKYCNPSMMIELSAASMALVRMSTAVSL